MATFREPNGAHACCAPTLFSAEAPGAGSNTDFQDLWPRELSTASSDMHPTCVRMTDPRRQAAAGGGGSSHPRATPVADNPHMNGITPPGASSPTCIRMVDARCNGAGASCLAERRLMSPQAIVRQQSNAQLKELSQMRSVMTPPKMERRRSLKMCNWAVQQMSSRVNVLGGFSLKLSAAEARERTQWDGLHQLGGGTFASVASALRLDEAPVEDGFGGGGGARLMPMDLHSTEEVFALEVILGAARRWQRARRRRDSSPSEGLQTSQ